jgi:adenosylcobyric acid synthase
MRGSLLVCGTASSVGKSTVATGLCRWLARRGVLVAPFKACNMSNNATVATDGGEIAWMQHIQARAAGIASTSAMNPVLVKPLDDRHSDLILRGRSVGIVAGVDTAHFPGMQRAVCAAFDELRDQYDVVIAEGAGSAAEINLLERDLANLPLAAATGTPAILVADIDRGGMLASVVGTVALLPDELRATLAGIVVNKFRGERSLLEPGLALLEARTGLPVLGVLPALDAPPLDSEDSLDLNAIDTPASEDGLDVAVVRYPSIANWSDLAPLAHDPAVSLRLVHSAVALGKPDLVVLPGSRNVLGDLAWMRARGLDAAIAACDASVFGICGGLQMLGKRIVDEGVESGGDVRGLGLVPIVTAYARDKIVRRVRGQAMDHDVQGYEIRHGRSRRYGGGPFAVLDRDEEDGIDCGQIAATNVHGLFEADGFRRAFLQRVASRQGRDLPDARIRFGAVRARTFDALADLIEAHLDPARLAGLIA